MTEVDEWRLEFYVNGSEVPKVDVGGLVLIDQDCQLKAGKVKRIVDDILLK